MRHSERVTLAQSAAYRLSLHAAAALQPSRIQLRWVPSVSTPSCSHVNSRYSAAALKKSGFRAYAGTDVSKEAADEKRPSQSQHWSLSGSAMSW